jgi:hypothetical protein
MSLVKAGKTETSYWKELRVALLIAAVLFLLAFVGCRVLSNQRIANRLNPVWEVQGHVVYEDGRPVSGAKLQVMYLIGYYPVSRVLEQMPISESEVVNVETNGFFSIRKQCSDIFITMSDPRYQVVDPTFQDGSIMFSKEFPDARANSDKNLKLVVKLLPNTNSASGKSSTGQ